MTNSQEWLDKNYPKDTRKEISNLEIDSKRLGGDLTKLIIITDPRRNWQEFYYWLHDNIVDIDEKGPNKGNIKATKRGEYPTLISRHACIGYLMNAIEYRWGKNPLDYSGYNTQNTYKEPVLPYDDNKTFFQLASGQNNSFKCGLSFVLPRDQNILNEFEKLLTEWRSSTNKTLTIKLEQIKAFQTQLVEKEQELTESKNKNTNLEQEKNSLQSQLTNQQEENKNLKKQLVEKDQENKVLKNQVYDYQKTNLEAFLAKKEQELTKAKENIITANNLEENEDNKEELTNLLEEQASLINLQLNKESEQFIAFAEKQLNKTKKRLTKLITNEGVTLLCRLQTELTQLQNQEQELQAKIEMPV